MTKDEIKEVIETLVRKYERDFSPPIERLHGGEQFDPPDRKDWEFLERKFNCSFSPEFVAFVELIVNYNLPGMLNVTREGKTNGNATMDWRYDHEMSFGTWNADMIPFIAVGNGDFFCLSAGKGAESGVYYVDHGADEEEEITKSFAAWIEQMEKFLYGEEP